MRRLNSKDKEKLQKTIKNIKSTNLKIENLLFEVLQEYITDKNSNIEDLKICNDKITKFKNIFNISSDLWYLAGDQSSDYNYYTKRIILSSIISKIYLKMLCAKNYSREQLKKDIKEEIIKVGKFNKFKAECLSFINVLKNGSKTKGSGRGY
jgi:ubiquinone biosynthesis protein COQ9